MSDLSQILGPFDPHPLGCHVDHELESDDGRKFRIWFADSDCPLPHPTEDVR